MMMRAMFTLVVGQIPALLIGEHGENIVIVAHLQQRQLAFRFPQGLR